MNPPPALALPIDEYLEQALELLKQHQNLVVVAAPGAGKTTRLPAFLARHLPGKVLVLEPRRMAAIAAANRVAEEQSWELGQQVGYQVRFANSTSKETRLFFLTEALLSRKLAEDPELSGVECVILDEFHERSLHVDLALGILRELQQLGSTIKLVVMSATLDAEKISKYLGNSDSACPVLEVPGKLFPLDLRYQKNSQLLQTSPAFFENLVQHIKEAERATAHDILVFLPGVGEIERATEQLDSWAQERKLDLIPLHGSLPLESQRKALQKGARKRIVLSTNIAESSVTVDGVACVIDSGLSRSMKFDLRTGFSRLELGRISRSSAQQRAGRAARQFPGTCFRLWNKLDETSMPLQDVPEIQRSELSESLLFLAAQGVRNFDSFSWYQKPSAQILKLATQSLEALGALTADHEMTHLGHAILKWPLPPRLAALMMAAEEKNVSALGADIAAILQEKDFLSKQSSAQYLGDGIESDLLLRLEILEQSRDGHSNKFVHRNSLQTVQQSARQILSLAKKRKSVAPIAEDSKKILAALLFSSFSDRLCRRRQAGSDKAIMVGGRGVRLAKDSIVKDSEFFLALDGVESGQTSETMVSVASGIEKNLLLSLVGEQVQKNQTLSFEREKGQFYIRQNKVFRDLIIEEGGVAIANAREVAEHLPQVLLSEWDWLLKENENLNSWLNRFRYLIKRRGLLRDLKLRAALATFDEEDLFTPDQKAVALTTASEGEHDFFAVARKNLIPFFEGLLEPLVLQALSEQVPAKMKVPSGSWIDVHYPIERDPYIEVRIQEVFGWTATPKLIDGQQALTLSLLGPNYRPMQITSNLESFWQSAYIEVRKELRLRYPKHSWPEDPLTATAVAKGRSTKK